MKQQNTSVKRGAVMTDARGRVKRRGNYRPHEGKTYVILPLATPLDDWATHVAIVCERPVGVGSPESLRDMMYRQGANEVPE